MKEIENLESCFNDSSLLSNDFNSQYLVSNDSNENISYSKDSAMLGDDNNVDLDYIPSESEEYMNPRQLGYFRNRLIHWKNELIEESEKIRKHLATNNFNESDITDRANVECDTFYEINNRDRNRKLISKIDNALRKIENGEYGYCEETGKEIGIKRLQARLVATLCIEAQELKERKKKNYGGGDFL